MPMLAPIHYDTKQCGTKSDTSHWLVNTKRSTLAAGDGRLAGLPRKQYPQTRPMGKGVLGTV